MSLLAALAPPRVMADPDDDYNVALQFFKQERWDTAARSFRAFLKENPEHPQSAPARLYLGQALVHLRKFGESRDVFREYVRLHGGLPEAALARFRIAESSYFLQDNTAALRELDDYLQRHPDHELVLQARLYRGQTQLRLNDAAAAAATLTELIGRRPPAAVLSEAEYALARAREALRQPDEATPIYERLAADPQNPFAADARFRLGALAFEAQDYARAADQFSTVARDFPEHRLAATASLNAGYAEFSRDRLPEALALFAQAAAHPEHAATADLWTGLTHKRARDFTAAAATLRNRYQQDENQPLADKLLFHWADCEFQSGHYAEARRLFLGVTDRWPDGERADDSLHLATEAALRAGDFDAAEQLNGRFEKSYPGSGLRWLQQVLAARIRLAQGDALRETNPDDPAALELYRRAIDPLARVIRESGLATTQSFARLQLARVHDRLADSPQVVETVQPIVRQFEDGKGSAELVDSLLLASRHLITLGRHADAARLAQLYLDQPAAADRAAAWGDLALARTHLDDETGTLAALDQLSRLEGAVAAAAAASYRCAESAYATKKWDFAAALYERTAAFDPAAGYRAAALSGLGYSRYEAGQYAAAAEAFAAIVASHADDRRLASNAVHMQGLSHQQAGDVEAAVTAYLHGLRQFALPVGKQGDEIDVEAAFNAYRCGKGAGRVLRELGRVDEADAAYQGAFEVLARLPADRQAELDRLINEWALLSYENHRYQRSDELFRLLIDRRPESDLADDARLYLGESQFFAGELKEAAAAFEALAADPRADQFVKHRASLLLLDIYADREDWKQLLASADRFAQQFPESGQRAYARYRAGEAALQAGQHARAIDELTQLTQPQDDAVTSAEWYSSVWVLLAEAQFRAKQYEQVATTVAAFGARFPGSPLQYHADEVLGRSYMKRAMLDEARTVFQKVINSETGRRTKTAARAQFNIAETYLIEKNYDSALAEYYKVYVNYPFPEWQAPALFQAGQCDESLENWRQAVQSYETLIKEFPDSEFAGRARSRLDEVGPRSGQNRRLPSVRPASVERS